jgi:hypothetical protein
MTHDEEPWRVDVDSLSQALKKVQGITVHLSVIPDRNAVIFADDLALSFRVAGWNCIRQPTSQPAFDGVGFSIADLGDKKAWAAVELLHKEFSSRDIPAFLKEPRFFIPGDWFRFAIPANSIFVLVGNKLPAPLSRIIVARSNAHQVQDDRQSREAISNAWYEVFRLKMEYRQRQIEIGLWPTNWPMPRFFPGGHAADGTPLGMDGKPILGPDGKPIPE